MKAVEGSIYKQVLTSLTGFYNSALVENYVTTGAAFIRRELEADGIYFQAGPTLEGIVFNSPHPNRDLQNICVLIDSRLEPRRKQEIVYGAIVAVYKVANDMDERVVPFEKLLEYYAYVQPILDSLMLYKDYGLLNDIYENNIKYNHI